MKRLRRNDAAPRPRRRRVRVPQETPPGFPFPCDDELVGQRVSGRDFAGRVLGCAAPPEGKRGRFLYVGGSSVTRGRVTRAAGEGTMARAQLAERWAGPDYKPPARASRGTREAPEGPRTVTNEDLFREGVELARARLAGDPNGYHWLPFWGLANVLVARRVSLPSRRTLDAEGLAYWPSQTFADAVDNLHFDSAFDFILGGDTIRPGEETAERYRKLVTAMDSVLAKEAAKADKPSSEVFPDLDALERAMEGALDGGSENELRMALTKVSHGAELQPGRWGWDVSPRARASVLRRASARLAVDAAIVQALAGRTESVSKAEAVAERLDLKATSILEREQRAIDTAKKIIEEGPVRRVLTMKPEPISSLRAGKDAYNGNRLEPGRYVGDGGIIIDGEARGVSRERGEKLRKKLHPATPGRFPQSEVESLFAKAGGEPLHLVGAITLEGRRFVLWIALKGQRPYLLVRPEFVALVYGAVGMWDEARFQHGRKKGAFDLVWLYRRGQPIAAVVADHLMVEPDHSLFELDVEALRARFLSRTNGRVGSPRRSR